MLIQCTKTLLERLALSPSELSSPEGYEQLPLALTAWQANLVTLDRRKALILMNNATRFPVVIYRPKPKDFTRIERVIEEAIRTALRMEGVREKVIDRYFGDAGEVRFSRTADKGLVARLNHTVREIAFMEKHLDKDTMIQRYFSMLAGRHIQKFSDGKYDYPISRLIEQLGRYCNDDHDKSERSVLEVELYQLKIRIRLEETDIWRRVQVPSNFSFRHLHKIIQAVFDWQGYHLHMFEAVKSGARTKQILMDDDPETLEWIDRESYDILQERFTALEDIFPGHEQVTYEYDFGDSWIHELVLEEITTSNRFSPLYLDGRGERPPEDVGGEGGYQEYLRIIADSTDPEHEEMKLWAESQRERKQEPEELRRKLDSAISGYY